MSPASLGSAGHRGPPPPAPAAVVAAELAATDELLLELDDADFDAPAPPVPTAIDEPLLSVELPPSSIHSSAPAADDFAASALLPPPEQPIANQTKQGPPLTPTEASPRIRFIIREKYTSIGRIDQQTSTARHRPSSPMLLVQHTAQPATECLVKELFGAGRVTRAKLSKAHDVGHRFLVRSSSLTRWQWFLCARNPQHACQIKLRQPSFYHANKNTSHSRFVMSAKPLNCTLRADIALSPMSMSARSIMIVKSVFAAGISKGIVHANKNGCIIIRGAVTQIGQGARCDGEAASRRTCAASFKLLNL